MAGLISYSGEVAAMTDANAATIFSNISYWVSQNERSGRNHMLGRHWTFNSARKYAEMYPQMSLSMAYRALRKLEDAGLIESANLNRNRYDRTRWYTLTDKGRAIADGEAMAALEASERGRGRRRRAGFKPASTADGSEHSGVSIARENEHPECIGTVTEKLSTGSAIGTTDFSFPQNGSVEIATPIPVIDTVDYPSSSPRAKDEKRLRTGAGAMPAPAVRSGDAAMPRVDDDESQAQPGERELGFEEALEAWSRERDWLDAIRFPEPSAAATPAQKPGNAPESRLNAPRAHEQPGQGNLPAPAHIAPQKPGSAPYAPEPAETRCPQLGGSLLVCDGQFAAQAKPIGFQPAQPDSGILPDGWQPGEADRAYAAGLGLDIADTVAAFKALNRRNAAPLGSFSKAYRGFCATYRPASPAQALRQPSPALDWTPMAQPAAAYVPGMATRYVRQADALWQKAIQWLESQGRLDGWRCDRLFRKALSDLIGRSEPAGFDTELKAFNHALRLLGHKPLDEAAAAGALDGTLRPSRTPGAGYKPRRESKPEPTPEPSEETNETRIGRSDSGKAEGKPETTRKASPRKPGNRWKRGNDTHVSGRFPPACRKLASGAQTSENESASRGNPHAEQHTE